MKIAWVPFAKAPIEGYAKTRLAKNLGDLFANEIYKLILEWQWDNLEAINSIKGIPKEIDLSPGKTKINSKLFIYIASPLNIKLKKAIELFHFLPKIKNASFHEQSKGDLGERLHSAVMSLKKKNDYVAIWGSDIPVLTKFDFEEILKDLSRACIIPAFDGGYCLIGINMQEYHPDLFKNIPWNSRSTLKKQKERFKELNIPLRVLPPKPDFDEAKDIIRNILYMQNNLNEIYKKRISKLSLFLKSQV